MEGADTMRREIITVERFFTEHANELKLKLVAGKNGLSRAIREPTVNRPGLVLSGFTRYFAYKRVQAVGNADAFYLKSLPEEERNLRPDHLLMKAANAMNVPVFQTSLLTTRFTNLATLALEMMFAPHGTEMG